VHLGLSTIGRRPTRHDLRRTGLPAESRGYDSLWTAEAGAADMKLDKSRLRREAWRAGPGCLAAVEGRCPAAARARRPSATRPAAALIAAARLVQ
jgi:hypothetical protein